MQFGPDERSVTPVIGTILAVAIVVVLAAVVGASFLGYSEKLEDLRGEMTYGENLIENPGFEDGSTAWFEFDESGNRVEIDEEERIIPTAGVDGSNGLQLETKDGEEDEDGDFVEQNLDATLLADADYRICISFRLETEAGGQGWVGIQHADGGEENHMVIWEVTDTEYQQRCEIFTADRELDNITAWAYTENEIRITVDDYVLQRTRYLVNQ